MKPRSKKTSRKTKSNQDLGEGPPSKQKKLPTTRKRLNEVSKEEKEKIRDHFKAEIGENKVPGKKSCEKYISDTGSDLTYQAVKSVIWNTVKSIRNKRSLN